MPHEYLREWMSLHKVRQKDLERLIDRTNISARFTDERPLPAEWIQVWAKHYGWTDEQIFMFQYDRPFQPSGQTTTTKEDAIELVSQAIVQLIQEAI